MVKVFFRFYIFDSVDAIAAKNNRVSKGEYPLGSGFPIGASSTPVGTRFSAGKSSVLSPLLPADAEKGLASPSAVRADSG